MAQDLGKTSIGIQPNAAALLSYLAGFITGIIVILPRTLRPSKYDLSLQKLAWPVSSFPCIVIPMKTEGPAPALSSTSGIEIIVPSGRSPISIEENRKLWGKNTLERVGASSA